MHLSFIRKVLENAEREIQSYLSYHYEFLHKNPTPEEKEIDIGKIEDMFSEILRRRQR
jgi:hypothetical protein